MDQKTDGGRGPNARRSSGIRTTLPPGGADCHRPLTKVEPNPSDSGSGAARPFGSRRDAAPASSKSRIRSPISWQVFARAKACRSAARPSSERRSRIRTDGTYELGFVFDDVEPLGVEATLGDRRGDDGPSRAHRVHDLGRVARPVERMVDPIGDQADVECLVILGRVPPGAAIPVACTFGRDKNREQPSHQASPSASRTRPTTTIEASGKAS